MTEHMNRKILLVKRPEKEPDASRFKLVDEPVRDLKDGEILIQSLYLSVDPGLRGMMSDQFGPYIE